MNILNEVKEIQNQAIEAAELVESEEMSLLEKVTSAGFRDVGNLYLGIVDEVSKPREKRFDPMFKYIEDWIPALEEYIELLKLEKEFYEELYKKQKSKAV